MRHILIKVRNVIRKPLSLPLFNSVLEILKTKETNKINQTYTTLKQEVILLFAHYDCTLGEDTGEFTDKLLQAKRVSKMDGYKITTWEPITFIYTNTVAR